MFDHILHELLRSRELALKSSTVREGISHLSRAFALFSEERKLLEKATIKLQEELEAVNGELTQKSSEVNRLTVYLDTILSKITDAVLFIHLNGTIHICNESANRLLKLEKLIVGQNFWDVFRDETFGFSIRAVSYTHLTLPTKA